MVSSVHTNSSAMIALQNLTGTNKDLETVQQRLSTGYKVNGAQDNAAIYSVAQNMRGDIASLSIVKTSLDRASSIADVAIASAETISNLLIEMREKATAAVDPSIEASARTAYDTDFKALMDQIRTILTNANFDGANMIDGSQSAGIAFLADADATGTITLGTEDLSISGSIITLTSTSSLGTATLASQALNAINASLTNVNSALARMGSESKQIDAHIDFVSKLSDTLTSGVGDLVDADLAKESARLEALLVQQQLGVQSLSIANQNPQVILSLFQG